MKRLPYFLIAILLISVVGYGAYRFDLPAAEAAITFDAASSGAYANPPTANISWSHTVGASANYLIVYTGDYINGSNTNIPTVTYNGVSMTQLGNKCAVGFDSSYCDQMWGLANPSTGTNTVQVNAPGNNTYLSGGAWSFVGVDTTNPVDATSTNEVSATTAATSTITTIANNDFVVAGLTNSGAIIPSSVNSGNTLDWAPGGATAALSIAGAHTTTSVSAGAQSIVFNMAASGGNILMAVALNASKSSTTPQNPIVQIQTPVLIENETLKIQAH